jgi:adenine-specific DNA-methyltransferase
LVVPIPAHLAGQYERSGDVVMAGKKKMDKTTPVESVKHTDKRASIPTEELRDFVKEDETHPKTILYPRDPSLEPQLVWKGKDDQDREDLAVPAVNNHGEFG